jgi:hypothetical protein
MKSFAACIRHLNRSKAFRAAWRLVSLRMEVKRAVRDRSFVSPRLPSPDAVLLKDIPSVERLGAADRVLAEIDQDGYEFPVHPIDASFFKQRDVRLPRVRYQISVVLRSGAVCLSKRFVRQPLSAGVRDWLKSLFGLNFYTEAAALIRLKNSDAAPRVVDIDLRSRTIYREFIRGEACRQLLARQGLVTEDVDIQYGSASKRSKRPTPLIPAVASLAPAKALVQKINAEGVVLLDVKLGNIVLGDKTRAMYWIDFETARFDTEPDWEERVEEQHRMLATAYARALRQAPHAAATPLVAESGDRPDLAIAG